MEVIHEVAKSVPVNSRVWVDGYEDLKEVLNVRVFRYNPSCLIKPGYARIDFN
jgi:hypothetical protein